jgi:chromosome segregation ATPase
MNNSDETLKRKSENEAVLQAIAELARTVAELSNNFGSLSNRFDNLEKFVTVQFDAVREGIEYNSARYDRLEAKFFDVRSDVSNMRADIKELAQVIRKKELA